MQQQIVWYIYETSYNTTVSNLTCTKYRQMLRHYVIFEMNKQPIGSDAKMAVRELSGEGNVRGENCPVRETFEGRTVRGGKRSRGE